ncbi:hypothetical protein L218DRAFT_951282 [Marasmius fiardii PR-910]|nr:hypothetical protein L218DRAFT_951282 [Marasmius fiardii PR-910]
MTDEDGNTRLFRLAEVENSNSDNDNSPHKYNPSEDEKIWARHDDGSESESHSQPGHSPDSYGGSQYTSDSEPDECTGFMFDIDPYDASDSEIDDYTNLEPPDRFAAIQDGSDSDTEYALCHSELVSELGSESHLTLDFNEYFCLIDIREDNTPIASVEPKSKLYPNVAGWIELNGVKAFALFDSGSTADAISPDFTRAAKMKIFRLENLGYISTRYQGK